MSTVANDGGRRKVRITLKPADDPYAAQRSKLRAQAASLKAEAALQCEQMRADDSERALPRAKEFQKASEPKTSRAEEYRRAEEPKSCPSSISSPSSRHDPVDAVAREVIHQIALHARPAWQTGWLLARALRQYRLEALPDVLGRAARAAVAHAEALHLDRWHVNADDLEIEMMTVGDSIRIVDFDVVGTAARLARERPGTIHVQAVPDPIRHVVITLWHLSQLGHDGVARPSQDRLGKALGYEPKMVSRYLTLAERKFGLIECVDPTYIPGRKAKTWRVIVGPTTYTPPSGDA